MTIRAVSRSISVMAVLGCLLAACGGSNGGLLGRVHSVGTVGTSNAAPASNSGGSGGYVHVACGVQGGLSTVPLGSAHDLAHTPISAAEGNVMQSTLGILGSYLSTAWPSGVQSGVNSAISISQWVSQELGPNNQYYSALQAGPASISAWPGGQPSPAAAAGVAFDERFLFWGGAGSFGTQTWGSVTVSGVGRSGGFGIPGGALVIGTGGTVVGACIPWGVELGVASPSGFRWWLVSAVAAIGTPPGLSGTAMENPFTSARIFETPGSPGSRPSWVPISCSAVCAPVVPSGSVSGGLS